MRKLITLLVTLLTSLLVASVIQASPVMGLQQLLGFGSTDVTTQQVGPRYYGYGPYGYGPSHDSAIVKEIGQGSPESTTVKGVGSPSYGYGPGPYFGKH